MLHHHRRTKISPSAENRIFDVVSLEDIADLLAIMPQAVDATYFRAPQVDEAGQPLPRPVLHIALALDDRDHARRFLQEHGAKILLWRLDPRGEGKLLLGFRDDGEAKRIARDELELEIPEGLFGRPL